MRILITETFFINVTDDITNENINTPKFSHILHYPINLMSQHLHVMIDVNDESSMFENSIKCWDNKKYGV